LLTVVVDIPTRIGQEERELLEKLAKIRGDRVGKGGVEGIIGKIFGG
jgi:molecular chaperone DnaJ